MPRFRNFLAKNLKPLLSKVLQQVVVFKRIKGKGGEEGLACPTFNIGCENRIMQTISRSSLSSNIVHTAHGRVGNDGEDHTT